MHRKEDFELLIVNRYFYQTLGLRFLKIAIYFTFSEYLSTCRIVISSHRMVLQFVKGKLMYVNNCSPQL